MAQVKTYDAKQISVIFGGRIFTGFAEDSKVSVARANDSFTMKSGVDGEVTRSKSNDRSGTVTINLMTTSSDNDFLAGILEGDELSNTGILPIIVKDNNGTTLHTAPEAWVRKPADDEKSKEAGSREWNIDCANLLMHPGGNN